MNILKFFFFLSSFIVLSSSAFGEFQSPPPLKDVKTLATIDFNSESGVYTYLYDIYNPPTNTLTIVGFYIDVTSAEGDAVLSREGLVNGPCYDKYNSEYFLEQIKMVPVGIDGPPGYKLKYPELMSAKLVVWTCGLIKEGMAGWDALIPHGEVLKGAKLTSYGLPGIRQVLVSPSYVVKTKEIPEEDMEEYIENTYDYLDKIYTRIAFHGKTLGPTAPPADFKPLAFIDYIITLKHEAAKLGWIKNEGIVNSLDVKLENAKKAIERNNIRPAKNLLEAFINEVEAQGCAAYEKCAEGKHITPEGYGLLKYNAEYLLERL